jgi:hypothetical protein
MVVHPTVGIQAHWPKKTMKMGWLTIFKKWIHHLQTVHIFSLCFFYLRKALVVQVFPQDLPR